MVVDLLVPAGVAGPGRRSVEIPPHDAHAARKANGLEGALVDRDPHVLRALDPEDGRQFTLRVAGPAALLVSKVIKISERAELPSRRSDKDALDVLRLLRAVPTAEFVSRLDRLLAASTSAGVTAKALELAADHFGRPGSLGCVMAARAAAPLEAEEVIAASTAALTQDLLAALDRRSEPGS